MKSITTAILLSIIAFTSIYSQNINGYIVSDSANLTVVKIWGTHEQRGFAYGYLLGDKISDMVTGYMQPVFGGFLDDARQIIIDGEDLSIDSIFVYEAMAMIDGMNAAGTNSANIDYIDGLVFNSFLDIVKLLGLSAEGPGCSSLMSWGDATMGTDLDGKSVISRHLDWTPNPTLINNQVLVIHVPSEEDEQTWAMVGFAGQMSVLSGFNQNLAVFQHMMSDFIGVPTHGIGYEPVWLTMRKAIEKADYNNDGENNTADIRDAINGNTMGFADGYIITALAPSTSGNDELIALVAEVAPQTPKITFRDNTYPDNIPGDNLYAANFEIKRNNSNHYCTRYYAVINAIGDGTGIGSEENWQIMNDNSNGSNGNIQFMQFIPETDMFKITVYRDGSPAYQKPPITFSISELFFLPLSVSQVNDNAELELFPNPVEDKLVVKIPKEYQNSTYSIFSIDGDIALFGNIENGYSQIKVNSLDPGLYIFKVDGLSGVKFLVR